MSEFLDSTESLEVPSTAAPQNALGAANMASGSNNNGAGTPIVIYRVPVADAVTGNVDTLTVTHAIRIIDAWVVKTGGAGGGVNTIQVQTAAGVAVTDAMDINIADQTIQRAATIDDATHEFAAGVVVRIRRVKAAGNAACIAYIMAVRT